MDRSEIVAALARLRPALRAEGVDHIAIFGSRARGDDSPGSDLDVLIDIAPGARFSLLNLSGVGLLIEDTLGVPSQIVLRRSLPEKFAARIADDIIPVF